MKISELKEELKSVKILLQRTLATEKHEEIWKDFELATLLKFRCQAAAGFKVLVSLFLGCVSRESWQIAKKHYLDDISEEELQLTETQEYLENQLLLLKVLAIVAVIVRVIIFVAAFKIPQLSNVHFYNEIASFILTAFIPRKAFEDTSYMAETYFQATLIIFCLFYNNLWRGLICCGLVPIAVYVSRRAIYKSTDGEEEVILFVSLVLQNLALIFCHLFITKIGFMFVESEVSRLNDQSLFDVI